MKRTITISAITIIVVVTAGIFPHFNLVYSRNADEVASEISEQLEALEDVKGDLSAAEKKIATLKANIGSIQGEIPKLEAQIEQLEAEIDYNKLQTKLLGEQQELKVLERERIEIEQRKALHIAYKDWKAKSGINLYLRTERSTHPLKKEAYQSEILSMNQGSIEDLTKDIGKLGYEIDGYVDANSALDLKNKELQRQKDEVEARIAALRGNLSGSQGAVAGLRSQVNSIQANINQLSEEQRALEAYEASLQQNQAGNGGNQEVQAGQYYFWGKGRDAYQGHGVGMSQFGAFGAGRAGWSAEKIVTFYYKETHIEERPGSVNVQGYGRMDINKYVAGLGEIPSKACGNAQQAAARPDKYVVDNTTTIWDCWPEETIKAQVIAARSYAMHRGGTICTTAACQVYVGGTAKQWAADETHNQVIVSHGYTHNGNVIEALYSSDNNQGYGTADNDTIWSNNAGDGTAYSYLRHVNDTGTAYNYSWTNWTWRTDGFAINQIRDMLSHVNRNGSYTSSRGFVNGVLNDVGNIANISFERDGSNRVKKVVITGTNGTTRKMAGWLFKNIWNSWVANEQPHGSVDYIYSKTFFLLQQ